MNAIGMHSDASADTALERFAEAAQTESMRQAATWQGATRSRRGFEALKKIMANDPSDRVRSRTVQALAAAGSPKQSTW